MACSSSLLVQKFIEFETRLLQSKLVFQIMIFVHSQLTIKYFVYQKIFHFIKSIKRPSEVYIYVYKKKNGKNFQTNFVSIPKRKKNVILNYNTKLLLLYKNFQIFPCNPINTFESFTSRIIKYLI